MSTPMSRRSFTLGSIAAVVGGSAAFSAPIWNRVLAQSTPQASPEATLDYPELTVTITDQEAQVSAESVAAGYILLTVVNQSSDENGAGLLGPGPDQTMDDLRQAASEPDPSDTGFPPFLYNARILGGPGTMPPGETAQAVINVPEGDWAVFAEGNQAPVFLTATAGTSSAEPPVTSITIAEVDFAFGGFAQTIRAGSQIWEVVNEGQQPHMLDIARIPEGTTLEQIQEIVAMPEDATPAPGMVNPEDFVTMGGVLLQSPGTTVWPLLDLPAGHYTMVCFMPDPMHGGIPHAMEGMVAVFDVG